MFFIFNTRELSVNIKGLQALTLVGPAKENLAFDPPSQGTLYSREGYGTICAVVNQLWACQFYPCTNFVQIVLKAYSTVGQQLHIG